MEAKAVVKYVRISSRKARQVIDLIRGKEVEEARTILKFSPKAGAGIIGKVLDSAIANAQHNLKLRDELFISEAYVNQGPTMKRYRPRAMGRATPILKRTSHITMVVSERKEGGAHGSKG